MENGASSSRDLFISIKYAVLTAYIVSVLFYCYRTADTLRRKYFRYSCVDLATAHKRPYPSAAVPALGAGNLKQKTSVSEF
jgi:hypothetical protein